MSHKVAALAACMVMLVGSLPAAAANPERGAQLWEQRCTGCHSLDANRVGPLHRGVYGRTSGTAPEFNYSQAVRNAGVVWRDDTLERWLTNPQTLIPGQRMNFRIGDAGERADIIAYLRSLSPR